MFSPSHVAKLKPDKFGGNAGTYITHGAASWRMDVGKMLLGDWDIYTLEGSKSYFVNCISVSSFEAPFGDFKVYCLCPKAT